MRIWKYKLKITDRQSIDMPKGAKVLDVQMQGDTCCLWALCDEEKESIDTETIRIVIYGTGNPIPDEPGEYISTFQVHGGKFVFHAFELAR